MAKVMKMTNGKMEIKNKTESKAELYFYGDIVSNDWMMWSDSDQCPGSVKDFLNEVKDVEELDIYINSGGGSVFAGMAIYNMLKRSKANKTVYVDGLAGSIASVIALAGDKVVIPSNAYFMIHKAWSYIAGNSKELRKMADTLETIEEGILNVYEQNLKDGVSIDTIKEMMEEETWLTGKKAGEYFNIEVSKEIEAVACVSDMFKDYKKVPDKLNKSSEISKNDKDDLTDILAEKLVNKLKNLTESQKNLTEKPLKNENSECFFNMRKKLLNT